MHNLDFLQNIAKGFNPYTGEKFPEEDILLSPSVSTRLMELVKTLSTDYNYSNILERNTVKIIYPHTSIQPFSKAISYAIYNALTFGEIQNSILNFLLDENKLEFRNSNGRMKKYATFEGEAIGIKNAIKIAPNETKQHIVIYEPSAQMYIIDRLETIIKSYQNRY